MHSDQTSPRPLPGLVPLILLCGVLTVTWMVTPETHLSAASAPAAVNNEALTSLVGKLKAQQDMMTDNQTKIEAQIAVLKVKVGEAKNFAHRLR